MTGPRTNGFSHEELEKLLGGYATDTLTAEEREALFTASLANQALFDALADEEALREVLGDSESRRSLLESIQPAPKRRRWAWAPAWLSQPRTLALAGSLATVLLVGLAVRYQMEQRKAVGIPAETLAARQAPGPEPGPQAASGGVEREPATDALRSEDRLRAAARPPREFKSEAARESFRDFAAAPPAQPAPTPKRIAEPLAEAAPPAVVTAEKSQARQNLEQQKLKVALLGFQAGNEQDRRVEEMLAKKLDAIGQYSLVDRKEVERVIEARKLQNKPLDTPTAASIGRSLGADTVILADLEPADEGVAKSVRAKGATESAAAAPVGGVAGYRMSQVPRREPGTQEKAREDKDAGRPVAVNLVAQAIDSRTAANVGTARTQNAAPAALGDSVNQVASQLNAQLARQQVQLQNVAPPPFEGLVTDVNATVLTIDLGSRAGVRAGDRLEVRRGAQSIGVLNVTRAEPAFSVGAFQGTVAARAGDKVLKPR